MKRPANSPNAGHSAGQPLSRSAAGAVLAAFLLLTAPAVGADDSDPPSDAGGLATRSATPAPGQPGSLPDIQADQAPLDELGARVEDLTLELELVTRERDRLAQLMASLEAMYPQLEADRLLLTELRKPLPQDRAALEAYIERLRSLALLSDPARLGLIVDRLMQAAPDYLAWMDRSFGSSAEADQDYVNSGAAAFATRLEELRAAILLSVANRLDGLLNTLDRIR